MNEAGTIALVESSVRIQRIVVFHGLKPCSNVFVFEGLTDECLYHFLPDDVTIDAEPGEPLLQVAARAGCLFLQAA
jgi:hypothetical protein